MQKTSSLILAFILFFSGTFMVLADNIFTPAETQQISIATPGLFAKSQSFSVNFGNMKPEEYSFPLPVGKAQKKAPYGMLIKTQEGDAVKSMFNGTGILRPERSNRKSGSKRKGRTNHRHCGRKRRVLRGNDGQRLCHQHRDNTVTPHTQIA